MLSLSLNLPGEEFENLLACVIKDGPDFHSGLTARVLGAIGMPCGLAPLGNVLFLSGLSVSQHGKGMITGENILYSTEFRLPALCRPLPFLRINSRTISSSLVPRDLSLRNKF